MLTLHPSGIFARTIRVTNNGHEVATIKDRAIWEGSRILIQGVQYDLSRTGMLSGDYVLSRNGQMIARGHKPSMVSRRMTAEFAGQNYDLVPDGVFTSRFRVERFGERVGTIGPRPMRNAYPADLPAEIHVVYQVFMIALVALMWTRGDN